MKLTNHSAIMVWLAALTLVPSMALAFSGDSLLVQWSHLISSSINSSSDLPVAVTTDALGNVIVAGRSEGEGSAFDILTIKYDSQGRVVWSRRYDGWHHGFDIPNAVAVDSEGNVIVAGRSDGADSSDSDIVTIKYSSTGEVEWVARYDGLPVYIQGERYGSADVVSDLAVDDDGNVFVCGMQSGRYPGGVYGPYVTRDILTLKYRPDGTEEWANAFDGTFHQDDNAAAIAVDTEGNAVVTGWTADSTTTSDWAAKNMITIKYSTHGEELWNMRYQETDFSIFGKDIAVGMDGSVVVTGELNVWYPYPFDSRHDIVTVKYSSEGALQWADVFDAAEIQMMPASPKEVATGLTVDIQGNVYVAGSVSYSRWELNPDSILTIKYSPSGVRTWVRYFGKGSNTDILSGGVVSGPEGTVFALGFKGDNTLWADSTVLIQYDSAGNQVWVRVAAVSYWQPQLAGGLAVDDFGNAVVIAPTEFGPWSDFGLRSYSMQGGDRWVAESDGRGSCVSFVRDGIADSVGNVIVTGALVDSIGTLDFFTAKYDRSGTQLWYSTFSGVPGGDDGAFAITLDDDGNIYVAGSSEGLEDDTDFMTIKYNSSGVEQWSERFHSSMGDRAFHVQVDAEGNVIVAGYPSLVKYDPDGLLLWSVNTGERSVTSMAVTDSGSIFVTNQGEEYLRKYDEDGGLVWSVFSEAVEVVSGDDGSVYATWALGTTKYDESGGALWHKPAEGGTWVKLIGDRVIIGGHDSLFVLTEGGVVEWRRPGVPHWIRDGGVAAVGADESLSLAGIEVDDGNSTGRLYVVQYSADGDLLRAGLYDDMGRGEFRPFYISSDEYGDVIVVGEKVGKDYSTMPFILKYSQFGLGTTGISGSETPQDYALFQNYPNPFNPTTKIGFRIRDYGFVGLAVFDLLGREVATIVNEKLSPGTYTRHWNATGLPSGVYFYRLQAGSFSETRKLLLLR